MSAEDFNADRFYNYLSKHLREVFRLLKFQNTLNSSEWETLQYSCNKFAIPLTRDQLLILQAVFSLIPKAGLRNLTQQRIKTSITKKISEEEAKKEEDEDVRKEEKEKEKIEENEETIKEKKKKKVRRILRETRNLFTLLNAQWRIRVYPPAFGLDRLFFHVQLSSSTSLPEIINFSDIKNRTLGASVIYREVDYANYLGILLLPAKMLKTMENYLKNCE